MEKDRKLKVLVLGLSVMVILLHVLGLLTSLILAAAIIAGSLTALSLLSEDHKLRQHMRRAGERLRKEVDGL
jgi:hypothetical protein